MKKKTIIYFLIVISCIAAFLRIYRLPANLFFGPEQGRDLLVIRDMVVSHKLTLIGAKTDIAGVFHGPLYYYLAAIPFALSEGSPVFISICLSLLQVVAIPFLYLLVVELTGKKRLGLITSVLYAVSFETIVYARWLSNPPLSLLFSVLFMLCVVRFVKGKQWYLVGMGAVYGILGQLEFINYLVFGAIGLAVLIRYFRVCKKTPWNVWIVGILVGLVIGFGTYMLFDIRHGFLVTKSLLGLLSGGGFRGTFIDAAVEMSGRYITEIGRTFGIFHIIGAIAVTVIGLYGWIHYRKTNQWIDILGIWMIAPIIALYTFRHGVLEQVFVGLLPAWIVAISLVIESVWQSSKTMGVVALVALLGCSACMYCYYIPVNEHVFFQRSQSRITYENELAVVHTVYDRAAGKPFYFQAFTIPLFWQDGWQYLFWYVGTKNYGYIPIEEDKSVIYVIIPKIYWDPFLSLFKKNWYNEKVQSWGKLTFEQELGEFTIEERIK